MNLLPQFVIRLFAITAVCLLAAIAWIVFDAEGAVEREAGLSSARVGQHLEALYWQEQVWRGRGRGRTGLNTPAPERQSFATLNLISPGVCVTFALRGETRQTLCSQTASPGPTAPGWFIDAYEALFPGGTSVERPLLRLAALGGTLAIHNAAGDIRVAAVIPLAANDATLSRAAA